MDQLAIDITDTEGVAVGDTATLIDNQENSLLSTPCVAVGRGASARGYSGADTGTHTRACTGERGGN